MDGLETVRDSGEVFVMRFTSFAMVAVFAAVVVLFSGSDVQACGPFGLFKGRAHRACAPCGEQKACATAKAAPTCQKACSPCVGGCSHSLASFAGKVAGTAAGVVLAPAADFAQSARTSAGWVFGRSRCAGGVCR